LFVEKCGLEWKATELLTGMGVPLPPAVRDTLHATLDELGMLQAYIYNSVRGIFSSDSISRLKPIMTSRGWPEDELLDICDYAKRDNSALFLDEYRRLCEDALEQGKAYGKAEEE